MFAHMFRRIAALALIFASAAPARDWAAHPAIVERPDAETLYALGDIHGDYDRLVTLLVAAHILEAAPAKAADARWSAGKATFVVTGDMIDKGPKPVDVLHLLMALSADAPKSGGEVILLAGNHEAEFLAGPDEGKAADVIADLKKHGYEPKQVAACKSDLGEFFCGLPFAAKVGDWFFSHGGNTAGRTIPQISAAIQKGVDKDGYGTKELSAPGSLLEARLGEGKKQWISSSDERALLQNYASALGVQHMVQGHQHNEVKFADGATRKAGQLYGYVGLLYLIDCGMSREIDDSHGAILKVSAKGVEAVYPDGSHSPVPASK
jgi:hypothetical protein